MKRLIIVLSFFAILLTAISCSSGGNSENNTEKKEESKSEKISGNSAEALGAKFYAAIKAHDYEGIGNMVNEKAFVLKSRDKWVTGMKGMLDMRGELKSFKKTGSDVNVVNNIERTTLEYTVVYEKMTFLEEVLVSKIGNDYKLETYHIEAKE